MKNKHTMHCHIIGKTTLSIRCADILLQRGHQILSIFSNNIEVIDWAHQHNLAIQPENEVSKLSNDKDFDYLFSIVNNILLEIPAYPHQKIINYHDSPLPRYAGRNATCWAILNNEQSHGISWHYVTEQVDAGDIIKQETFPLSKTETALSLNLACYEKAVTLLDSMIEDIENQTISAYKQDLSQRSLYYVDSRPYANGILCWEHTAEYIERLFRATYFGSYKNTFTTCKLFIDDSLLIPTCLKLTDIRSDMPPGIIVQIEKDGIYISTATYAICISEAMTTYGDRFTATELVDNFTLYQGYQLGSFNRDTHWLLENYTKRIQPYETFWAKQLENIQNSRLLRLCKTSLQQGYNAKYHDLIATLPITNALIERTQHSFRSGFALTDILFSLLTIYLFRINDYSPCAINLYDQTRRAELPSFHPIFSAHTIYTVGLSPTMQFTEVLEQTKSQLEHLVAHHTFVNDLLVRYPDIGKQPPHELLHVALVQDDMNYRLNPPSPAIIVIRQNENDILFYTHKSLNRTSQQMIRNMPGHIMTLLEGFLKDPHDPIHIPHILTEHEKHTILERWNQTDRLYKLDRPIHKQFEMQATYTPNRIAIQYQNNQLNYNAFNKLSNRLAHTIIQTVKGHQATHGYNPMVAICLPRSLELPVAIYGILKSGCAYVPIATDSPPERLQKIIDNIEAPLIITTPELYNKHTYIRAHQAKVLLVEPNWEDQLEPNDNDPEITFTEKQLAYVIHTSGSTGEPKGVLCTHRGLSNRILWMQEQFSLSKNDTVIQKTPYSFDVSVWEFTWPLIKGARLLLCEPEMHRDPEYLADLIEQEQVTTVHFVPSMLAMFLKIADTKSKCNSLKYIICSGEALSVKLRNLCINKIPHALLANLYGPTEASIDVTYWDCTQNLHPTLVPIGNTIANMKIYVLDKYLNPLPVGCVGEIHIGGVGLTLGYLNKPDITAEKLIPNPFAAIGDEQSKLLKTGDIARRLPDGSLDYIDRNDDQVKVRGMLISPSGVTSQLLTHPDIDKCAVLAIETKPGKKQLVAYYVTRPNADNVSLDNIRKHITKLLPAYMAPSHFIKLTDLPLTANGKLNKKSLPKPKSSQRDETVPYIPPRNQFETQLAKIWQHVLQLETIGINDNFFHTGGNSLLAAEVVMHTKRQLQKSMSLQDLFAAPTIKALAPILNADKSSTGNTLEIDTLAKTLQLPETIQGTIQTTALNALSKPRHILLTGATGFVGIYLLHQLCQYTKATIYCLVRAQTEREALYRLQEISRTHKLSIDFNRIQVICGDVSQNQLGLTDESWQMLCQHIDSIVHNAAWVNHLYDYRQLDKTNTQSVITLLSLASTSRPKPLYFTSTISAIVETTQSNQLQESFPTENGNTARLTTGYAQSKWLAERLLTQANQRGMLCSIFRLPWITGDSTTGTSDLRNDHNNCLIKSCIQLGIAPNWQEKINLMPVNVVSQAMAKIIANNPPNAVYNLANQHAISWPQLIEIINDAGYKVDIVSVSKWHDAILNSDNTIALTPFLPSYIDLEAIQQLPTQRENNQIQIDTAKAMLKSFGTSYPRPNRNLIGKYLLYMQKEQFLAPPSAYQQKTAKASEVA